MEHIQIPAHVQRMRTEREELEHRVVNLRKFVKENPTFGTLIVEERADMVDQLVHMDAYLKVLTQRLQRALENV